MGKIVTQHVCPPIPIRSHDWCAYHDGDAVPNVIVVPCSNCGGEGMLYTSRYGGNDPDVWPTGECPVCEGTGGEIIETDPIEEDELP